MHSNIEKYCLHKIRCVFPLLHTPLWGTISGCSLPLSSQHSNMGSRLPGFEQKRRLVRNLGGKIVIFTKQSVVKISFSRCIIYIHIHGGRILFNGQIMFYVIRLVQMMAEQGSYGFTSHYNLYLTLIFRVIFQVKLGPFHWKYDICR